MGRGELQLLSWDRCIIIGNTPFICTLIQSIFPSLPNKFPGSKVIFDGIKDDTISILFQLQRRDAMLPEVC